MGKGANGSFWWLLQKGEGAIVAMAAEGRALPAAFRFAAAPRRPIPFRSKRLAVLRSDAGGAAASLPFLRRPARRTNRLRPKLLETLTPSSPPPQTVLEADPSPGERGVGEDAQTVELQVDGHSFTMEFAESRAVRAEQGDAVGAFLLRSLFLVGFVTLQVACATWFFSSADGKEKRAVDNGAPSAVDNAAVLGQGKEGDLQLGEREVEFRQMVSAIQAMAKEARAAEARKASEKGGDEGPKGDIMEEVNQRVGKVRKRLPRVHRDAKAFGRSPVERGGNKQPKENTSVMPGLLVPEEVSEDRASSGEAIRREGTGSSNEASAVASTSKTSIPPSQSLPHKESSSSTISRNGSTDPKVLSGKTTEHKHVPDKAKHSQPDAVDNLWWLKLSYVLAIFLHRGTDRKKFRGLYSLKYDSGSEKGSPSSYTVAFQDRADATNFCYLLETFFHNLEDFSADVVPLSTQELHDAVRSKALNVIVVKRGQLNLYAGQPLAEAEMQLCSMME